MIDSSGAVTGTLNYITGWDKFSSNVDEQSGNYFPLKLDDKYSGKQITCEGTTTKKANDLEWVLLVKGTDSTFKFSTDDDSNFLTLTFKNATLNPKTIMMANTRAVKRKKTTDS